MFETLNFGALRALLRNPLVVWMLMAQAASFTGDWIQASVLPLYLDRNLHSMTLLRVANLLGASITILLGPVVRHFLIGLPYRLVVRRGAIIIASFTFVLAGVVGAHERQLLTTYQLFTAYLMYIAFTNFTAVGLNLGLNGVNARLLEDDQKRSEYLRLASVSQSFGRSLGGFTGGVFASLFGYGAPLLANALSFLGLLPSTSGISSDERSTGVKEANPIRTLRRDLKLIGENRAAVSVLLLAAMPMNGFVVMPFLPRIVNENFSGSPMALSWLLTASGLGAVVWKLFVRPASLGTFGLLYLSQFALSALLVRQNDPLTSGVMYLFALGTSEASAAVFHIYAGGLRENEKLDAMKQLYNWAMNSVAITSLVPAFLMDSGYPAATVLSLWSIAWGLFAAVVLWIFRNEIREVIAQSSSRPIARL